MSNLWPDGSSSGRSTYFCTRALVRVCLRARGCVCARKRACARGRERVLPHLHDMPGVARRENIGERVVHAHAHALRRARRLDHLTAKRKACVRIGLCARVRACVRVDAATRSGTAVQRYPLGTP